MKKAGWKELPIGSIIDEPGSAEKFFTGDWRSYRPIWHEDKCKHCMICWVYCPDSSIIVKDGKMVGIDLDHCKGCGICAKECKFNAIEMKLESECREEENNG